MTAREELRARGAAIRRELGLDPADPALLPGADDLLDEVMFGRVWARPGLALTDRVIASLAALTSVQRPEPLAELAGAALHIGLSPRLIQEVMLHCAMYAGLPTALASLAVVRDVLRDRGLPTPEEDLSVADLGDLESRGRQTMQALHAERAEGGYANPDSAAASLYATAIDYLYGEIWNRPGIDRRQRMICSVASFTALRLESQQRKFFRSALNVGLSRDEVLEIIAQTGPYSGFPPALNALAVAEEVLG